MGIDENKTFIPINIAVLTVSDTRTLETDTSGQTLVDRLTGAGHPLLAFTPHLCGNRPAIAEKAVAKPACGFLTQ